MSEELIYCSFCNKNQNEVDTVIAGVVANICNNCVAQCNEILNLNREICHCGVVARAVADNDLPIEYSNEQQRYYITGVNHDKLSFSNCFACGGSLIDSGAAQGVNFSKQHNKFHQIDNSELVQIRALIEHAKTIDELITILGEPDDLRIDSVKHSHKDKEIYQYKDVLKQANFSKNFQTVNLIAQELEDGKLQIAYAGKLKIEDEDQY